MPGTEIFRIRKALASPDLSVTDHLHIPSLSPGLALLIHQMEVNATHLTSSWEDLLTYVIYRPCLGHARDITGVPLKGIRVRRTCDLLPRLVGALSAIWNKLGTRRSEDLRLRHVVAGVYPPSYPPTAQPGKGGKHGIGETEESQPPP